MNQQRIIQDKKGDSIQGSYSRLFRVRWQECGAYGIVDPIHYIYFMQETSMAHATEHGYTTGRELKKGRAWVIRETEIEYLRPIRYGDTVKVSMQIGELRRTSVTRFYEFNVETTGVLVARSRSEFVCVNVETQLPIAIPEDVITEFFPAGIPGKPLPRNRFPKAPHPAHNVFQMRKKVEFRDLDMLRHVNNATYLSYMITSGIEATVRGGLPWKLVMDSKDMNVSSWSRVLYQGQAKIEDELEITTYCSDVGQSSAVFHDSIVRVSDRAPIALGHTRWVWINRNTLMPHPMPAEVRAAIEKLAIIDEAG
ncbi:MAG: acyl-CoA thioesterase [Anaerolineales bacterium]